MLSTNDEDFTIQLCTEICKYADELNFMDTQDFTRLAKLLVPILDISDEFQRLRFEAILGFPQMIIEDVNDRYKFPLFGYNRLPNSSTKWMDIKTIFNKQQLVPSLINRLYYFQSNERTVCEVFLVILEACLTNLALMKYIRYMPKEEPLNGEE